MKEYICETRDRICPTYTRKQELVRCKNCKHYHSGFNCDLMQKPIMTDDNWFCADGERGNSKEATE